VPVNGGPGAKSNPWVTFWCPETPLPSVTCRLHFGTIGKVTTIVVKGVTAVPEAGSALPRSQVDAVLRTIVRISSGRSLNNLGVLLRRGPGELPPSP